MAYYRSYRGGRRGRRWPFVLLVILLIAILFGFILFWGLSENIVFTEDGLRFTFFEDDTPAAESPSPTPTPEGYPPIVVITESPSPSPAGRVNSSSSTRRALYLEDIADDEAVARALELGGAGAIDTVIIDMKRDDGTLGFVSGTEQAVAAGANSGTNSASTAIASFKSAGLRVVARMSAFKDDLVPRKVQSTSVKVQSGVIWLDINYHGWMNPYNAGAREYVAALAEELCDMGADEILLENLVFPTKGRPQLIVYGNDAEVSRTDTIEAFVKTLNARLAEKGCALSFSCEAAAGEDATQTGLSPRAVYALVGRCYVMLSYEAFSEDPIGTITEAVVTLGAGNGDGVVAFVEASWSGDELETELSALSDAAGTISFGVRLER